MICEFCGLPIRADERQASHGIRHAAVNLCIARLHAELYQAQARLEATAADWVLARERAQQYKLALQAIQGVSAGNDFRDPYVDKHILALVNTALEVPV